MPEQLTGFHLRIECNDKNKKILRYSDGFDFGLQY